MKLDKKLYHLTASTALTAAILLMSPFANAQVVVSSGATETVDGAGGGSQASPWNIGNTLTVSSGTLNILNSGTVINTNGFVSSSGLVTVTGAGSSWINSSGLIVGQFGIGELSIADGAKVSDVTGLVGRIASSSGLVTVTGTGSSWTNSNTLIVGFSGTGTLSIAENAVVSINSGTGTVTVAQLAGSTGTLNIGAGAGDAAVATGTLEAASVAFGAGTGRIVFNHTDTNYDFAPVISGAGGIDVYSGTTTLTGFNTYTGDTNVHGGTLLINGSITDATTVMGGTLGGTGTLTGSVTVNNGAILAPGNSIGTINTGNLILNAGSTLLIEVTQTAADQVNVTGTVDVTGATLQVDDLAPVLQAWDQNFVVINNDGTDAVTGSFGSLVDNRAFLTPTVTYGGGSGNDVVLSFTPESFTSLTDTDENETSVANGLDDLGATSGSSGQTLRNLLYQLTSEQALTTFEDLAGEIHVSSVHTIQDIGGKIVGQLSGRFANLSQDGTGYSFGYGYAQQSPNAKLSDQSYFATDLATNEISKPDKFDYGYSAVSDNQIQYWGATSGYYSKTEADGNANGLTAQGFGFTLGGDKAISITTTVGFAFNYVDTLTRTDDGLSELNINSYSAALYALHQAENDMQYSGSFGYHFLTLNGSRQISNIGLTANSDYFAHQMTFQGEASKRYAYDDNKDIIPFLLAKASYLNTSAFIESGAGGANLVSTVESHFNVDLILGARVEVELDDDARFIFGGGYAHRFGDDAHSANYAFQGGGSFTTLGSTRNRNSVYVEAGFEKTIADNTNFFAQGSANFTNKHQSYTAKAGLKIGF